MNKIILSRKGIGWFAQYVGPHAAEIRRLYGSDTIATPWLFNASAKFVREDITRHNPNVTVEVQ
jgi:hypothetical protein